MITRSGSRQQQAGHVHARNQQHEPHGAGEHEQRRLHRGHELVLYAGNLEAATGALADCAHHGVDVVLRRPNADTCVETREGRQAEEGVALRIGRHIGNPVLHVRIREGEALRHHADHGAAASVERRHAADDRGIAVEIAPPRRVTQDDDGIGAGGLFAGVERAAEHRRHAQHRKRRGGHLEAGETRRVALPGQRRAGQDVAGDMRQRASPAREGRRSTPA